MGRNGAAVTGAVAIGGSLAEIFYYFNGKEVRANLPNNSWAWLKVSRSRLFR